MFASFLALLFSFTLLLQCYRWINILATTIRYVSSLHVQQIIYIRYDIILTGSNLETYWKLLFIRVLHIRTEVLI